MLNEKNIYWEEAPYVLVGSFFNLRRDIMFREIGNTMETMVIPFMVIFCMVIMCLLVKSIMVITLWYRLSL